MACPNLTAAINSYNTTLTQPISNSVLNIAMAGGLYNASNGNSDLDLMFLNVTIGRSPFTQGDVIIDFYSPAGPVTLLDLPDTDQWTQSAFSPVIGTILNNLNLFLNNVTIIDFTFIQDLIQIANLPYDSVPCHPNNPPTLNINGGGIYNCSGVEYSTLLYTWSELTINQTEFVNNTATSIVKLMGYSTAIVDSTFSDNSFVYLLNMSPSPATSPCTIVNSSFTNNIGNGEQYNPMLDISGGQWTITDTLFDGNTNVNNLVSLELGNVTMTGTTFTNNNITENGQIILVDSVNMTMDSCTFSDNIAPMEIAMADSNVTLNYAINMACPNLTAAINSYNTTLTQPISNSVLNIAMAGGLYSASNGNSNLDLMYLNVTIGRSPFTQGDVIIDYYSPTDRLSLFQLDDIPYCGKPTNITLDNLTLTNGRQSNHPVFSALANNLNIILNNISDFSFDEIAIQVCYDDDIYCHPSIPPTLTINGGRIINCTGSEYSTLIDASLESTFSGNNYHYMLSTNDLSPTTEIIISNSSFTNNTSHPGIIPPISIGLGILNISHTLFDGNIHSYGLIWVSTAIMAITGTTFTNNNITENGQILFVQLTNMTMDNCTFSDNTAPMEISTNTSNVTISNIVFGQVDGLSGGNARSGVCLM
eukprot:gene10593-12326_t